MLDFSFYDPPIEVAAGSPRLEQIMTRLKAAGLRPYTASPSIDYSAPDPLFVDRESAAPETLERLARAAMIGTPRQIVVLNTLAQPTPRIEGAIHLRLDKDMASLRSRLLPTSLPFLSPRRTFGTGFGCAGRPPRFVSRAGTRSGARAVALGQRGRRETHGGGGERQTTGDFQQLIELGRHVRKLLMT